MSWSALSLAEPTANAADLSQGLTVFSVSPWTHGVAERARDASWLSFPNAIDAVIEQLPGDAQAVFALAVSAASFKDLGLQIAGLEAVLPLKQLAQWRRAAEKRTGLEVDKLALVDDAVVFANTALNALPDARARMEKKISVDALVESTNLAASDPLDNLNSFVADKTAFEALVNTPLADLAGGVGWRFYAESNFSAELKTGHPQADQTLTVLLVFVGSPGDLAYLVEMMP